MNRLRAEFQARQVLEEAGLEASLLVRDLSSGDEICIAVDRVHPLASVVKLPLAVVLSERISQGIMDPAQPIVLPPDRRPTVAGALGPPGTSTFAHRAVVAVQDLLHLAVSLSDNRAADALFALVPPADVHQELIALGVTGFAILEDTRKMTLIGAPPSVGGDRNSGTARAAADLLTEVWNPQHAHPEAMARVRGWLSGSVHRQRLAPDFATDASRWSSKTGTDRAVRHEVGVVEHDTGETYAVCVLSRSKVMASHQPAADAALGAAARSLHDALRG